MAWAKYTGGGGIDIFDPVTCIWKTNSHKTACHSGASADPRPPPHLPIQADGASRHLQTSNPSASLPNLQHCLPRLRTLHLWLEGLGQASRFTGFQGLQPLFLCISDRKEESFQPMNGQLQQCW